MLRIDFLKLMLKCPCEAKDKKFLILTLEFCRNMAWFEKLFKILTLSHLIWLPIGIRLAFVDASLERLGVCWDGTGYVTGIPVEMKDKQIIIHFEMYNVVVPMLHGWADGKGLSSRSVAITWQLFIF